VPAAAAVPVPTGWSFVEGAAAITALMTEHNALVTAGRLQPGETALVHAAASGVATQAIQLRRVLGAGRIYGTTRSRAHARALDGLGLDELINTSEIGFADRVLELTGGPYLEDNLRAAAIQGRIIGVGRLGGATGTLDMEELARKRVELIGVTFRTRSDEEKFAIAQALRTVDLGAKRRRPAAADRPHLPLESGTRGTGGAGRQRPRRQDRARTDTTDLSEEIDWPVR
jgi:NADPH:quinone reductase-like Zn-dependent oxidoreductase